MAKLSLDELEFVKLGVLRGEGRKLFKQAEDCLPDGYAEFYHDESSLLSVLKLSKALSKHKKITNASLKKIEALILGCNAAIKKDDRGKGPAPTAAGRAVVAPDVVKRLEGRSMRAGTLEDAGPRAQSSTRKSPNRRLTLAEFAEYAGNEKDLERVKRAFSAADSIHEMKSPTSRIDFNPRDARALYEYLFPNKDEAESWTGEISPRIRDMGKIAFEVDLQKKYGDSRFHAIVVVNQGRVIGYTQWSSMPLDNGQMVVFWQYGGVADGKFMRKQYRGKESYREEGIASAFYALRHGITAEDARQLGYKGVVGTILEVEMKGQGESRGDIEFTVTRQQIHNKMGARAIMLEMPDGRLLTAHLQPSLGEGKDMYFLHIFFRPLHYTQDEIRTVSEMDKGTARALVASFIDNFDREGFKASDVDAARQIVMQRFAEARRVLLVPPEKLPTIIEMARMDPLLRAQVEKEYGMSLEQHERRITRVFAAMVPGKEPEKRLGS